MAKILVVDDDAVNRRLLVALLSYDGHLTIEAGDGDEAIALAKTDRPQLVISDIVMPSMDGFGLVRALREDPHLRGTRVIFYTANYHEREALQLATACQVERVIVKPSDPELLLTAVQQVLAGVSESKQSLLEAGFDREHLILLTNKLSQRTDALEASNARLAALADWSSELAAEADPESLMGRLCAGARNLIGARLAILAVWAPAPSSVQFFRISGLGDAGGHLPPPTVGSGALLDAIRAGNPWNARAVSGYLELGLPADYPRVSAFLAVPLKWRADVLGWLAVGDKLGEIEFNDEDVRTLTVLAGMGSRMYGNGARQRDLTGRLAVLREEDVELRNRLEERNSSMDRMFALWAGLNTVVAAARHSDRLCGEVCRILADWADIHYATIDLVNAQTGALHPIAASNRAVNGPGFRIACGLRDIAVPELNTGSGSAARRLICNDLRREGGNYPGGNAMLAQGYLSLAILPLVAADATLGRLVLCTRITGSFDESQLKILSEVGRTVAVALARIGAEAVVCGALER